MSRTAGKSPQHTQKSSSRKWEELFSFQRKGASQAFSATVKDVTRKSLFAMAILICFSSFGSFRRTFAEFVERSTSAQAPSMRLTAFSTLRTQFSRLDLRAGALVPARSAAAFLQLFTVVSDGDERHDGDDRDDEDGDDSVAGHRSLLLFSLPLLTFQFILRLPAVSVNRCFPLSGCHIANKASIIGSGNIRTNHIERWK